MSQPCGNQLATSWVRPSAGPAVSSSLGMVTLPNSGIEFRFEFKFIVVRSLQSAPFIRRMLNGESVCIWNLEHPATSCRELECASSGAPQSAAAKKPPDCTGRVLSVSTGSEFKSEEAQYYSPPSGPGTNDRAFIPEVRSYVPQGSQYPYCSY